MTQKAKSSLGEDGGNALLLGQLTNGDVSLHVSDGYLEDDHEAVHLEAFQAMDLIVVQAGLCIPIDRVVLVE